MTHEEHHISVDYDQATPRRMRRLAARVGAVLLIGLLVAGLWRWQEHRHLNESVAGELHQRPIVTTMLVAAAGGRSDLVLPGETAPWFESTIYARVSGYVAHWSADIGDRVRQGQLLATIDTPELDAQLHAAEAQFNAAESQVGVREAEAALATTTFARWRDSPKGVVSDQERDEKKADYDSAVARLNAARAQVALNQADVDHYRALTQFKRVVAPFDGIITERHVEVGNLVSASPGAATEPLYRMAQDDPVRVFVDVPQSQADRVMGQSVQATVRIPGGTGHSFTGKVTRSSKAIDPHARTLRVEIDLPDASRDLVPGAYVEVVFGIDDGASIKVPAAAMVFRSKGPQVAIVDQGGQLHYRDVTIARDEGNVVVLSGGIQAGDRVVLNVSRSIADGDVVDVRDQAAAAERRS